MVDDYIIIQIIFKRINQKDTQIKSMGSLIDFATSDEVEKYYGSMVVSDKIIDNTKNNSKSDLIESVNTEDPETESNFII